MSGLKKQMKKIQKQQERLNQLIRYEQAACPHVKKSGKSRLEQFQEGDILKGRCKKCGDVVVLDREYLDPAMLQSSIDVIKSALSEIRAAAFVGRIRLDDKTLQLMTSFDAEILRDIPDTMSQLMSVGDVKKKKKKGKKKKNKRKRFTY